MSSWKQATDDISGRAASAYLDNTPLASTIQSQVSDPWKHPSVLKAWLDQRASKLQRTFSRISDTANFTSFVETCSGASLVRMAIFRAKQNMFSRIPLTILPNKPERCFDNDEFQWYLADRIQATQPSSSDISALFCDCKTHATINNGRHFHTCIPPDFTHWVSQQHARRIIPHHVPFRRHTNDQRTTELTAR